MAFAMVNKQLEQLNKPVQKGHKFNCLYTRRLPKGKNSKPHLYFFTEDQEDLIISASFKNKKGMTYKMSLNSKEIKRKSLWFAGVCSDSLSKHIFIGSFQYKPGNLAQSIRIDCTEENARITLPPLDSTDYIFTDEQSPEDTFLLISNKTIDSNANNPDFCTIHVYLSDKSVLVIHQIAEDEYDVKISYPLTTFQAFCIACVLTN